MTLKQILYEARKRIFESVPPAPSFFYAYDVYWAYEEWEKFLEARGITKEPKKDWPVVRGDSMESDLYVPPELAMKMLVLKHLP